jgi:hypothetical protein
VYKNKGRVDDFLEKKQKEILGKAKSSMAALSIPEYFIHKNVKLSFWGIK